MCLGGRLYCVSDSSIDCAPPLQVNTVTVDALRTFLKSVGQSVGNKKKAELVQAVYDHFS